MAKKPRKAKKSQAPAEEKREHPRVSLELQVQCRVESFHQFMDEYSNDISLGGMFLKSRDPKPVGSLLHLKFSTGDGRKLIEGLGRVVRVRPPGSGGIPGMGIQFVNLDPESRRFIEEVVEENLSGR